MTGPTTAGLTAYNSAIASAISAPELVDRHDPEQQSAQHGHRRDLDDQRVYVDPPERIGECRKRPGKLDEPGAAGIDEEANSYIRNALNQITTAILSDQPAGSITASTVQTYKQAVRTADNAFILSISNAVQTAIAGSTQLDSTTVSSDVSTLQTAVAICDQRTGNSIHVEHVQPDLDYHDPVDHP